MKAIALVFVALLAVSQARFLFKETFDNGLDGWVQSNWKKDEGSAGKFEISAGKFFNDAEKDKGTLDETANHCLARSNSHLLTADLFCTILVLKVFALRRIIVSMPFRRRCRRSSPTRTSPSSSSFLLSTSKALTAVVVT
jgi:hypothetical protein